MIMGQIHDIKINLLIKDASLMSILYCKHEELKYSPFKTAPCAARSGEPNRGTPVWVADDKIEVCKDHRRPNYPNIITPIVHGPDTQVPNQVVDSPIAHEVIERVCIAQNIKPFKSTNKFRCLRPAPALDHQNCCDDFGQISISSITAFIKLLDHEHAAFPSCKIVVCADQGQRALTNAVFLLGAYMILKMQLGADDVARRCERLGASSLEPLSTSSRPAPDSGLTLHDCWSGLERGRAAGWVPAEGEQWGAIEAEQRARHGDAAHGGAEPCEGRLEGTLVALDLMRSHGFGAWEAMGWLRIVRAGPGFGEQQRRDLCAAEQRAARMRAVLAGVRLAQAGAVPRGFRGAFLPAARRGGSRAAQP